MKSTKIAASHDITKESGKNEYKEIEQFDLSADSKERKSRKLLIILVVIIFVISSVIGYYIYTINPFYQYISDSSTAPTNKITTSPAVTISPAINAATDDLIIFEKNKILYTKGKSLFITNGKSNEKVADLDGDIITAIPSHNSLKIAVTNKSKEEPGMFDYYKTKLSIINLSTKKITPIMSDEDKVINYQTWSSDNKYLAFWVNSGEESFVYDIQEEKPIFSVKGTKSISPVSPIVFGKQSAKIAFIQDKILYESDITGENKQLIVKDAEATRWVHEGPALPNIPIYSPDNKSLLYYNSKGDLLIINKDTNSSKKIESGIISEIGGGYSPNAFAVNFITDNLLLFYAYSNGNYSYGDPPPTHIFDINTNQIMTYSPNEGLLKMGSADLNSLFISPDKNSIVAHSVYTGQGLDVYNKSGQLVKGCSQKDFRYSFYNWGGGPNYASVFTVWSPDSKYILSESTNKNILSVLDSKDCKIYTVLNTPFNFAIWMPGE